ncbi:MAG: type pilus assembly protein PilM [Clostridia bacterium]|nr:type pilus assembly protein PilM [Clostridia bacterium]
MKLLRLFSPRNSLIGIDIGSGNIKAAVYQGNELLTARVPAPPGGFDDFDAMVAAIAEVASELGYKGRQAVTTVIGEMVIVRYFSLPRMSESELKEGMAYEIENHIPTGVQDMVVDWAVLDNNLKQTDNRMPIILAAAPIELVNQIYQLFKSAGLDLAAIDLVPLALCRALRKDISGEVIITDISGQWGNIVLVADGQPLFSRVITINKEELTQSPVSGAFELTREIQRSLVFLRSQSKRSFEPKRLIVTGDIAQMEGLIAECQEQLGILAGAGRPGIQDYQVSPDLTTAIGLALRGRKL